jgi:hypothetical protein
MIMAKIKTSALITDISGTIGGSTLKRNRGGLFVKNTTTPRRPRTEPQQFNRMMAAELSGRWQGLDGFKQEMWTRFAGLVNPQMSGFNAFMGLNMNLLKARYASLVLITSPPPTPSTPASIVDFEGQTLSTTQNRIFWTYPTDANTFVSVYWAVQSCYSHKGKEAWHLVGTVPSSDLEIVHTHDLPSGFVVSYKAFSIDLFGRLSPETTVISGPYFGAATDPGYYGYSAYGFSYYGG